MNNIPESYELNQYEVTSNMPDFCKNILQHPDEHRPFFVKNKS